MKIQSQHSMTREELASFYTRIENREKIYENFRVLIREYSYWNAEYRRLLEKFDPTMNPYGNFIVVGDEEDAREMRAAIDAMEVSNHKIKSLHLDFLLANRFPLGLFLAGRRRQKEIEYENEPRISKEDMELLVKLLNREEGE